MKGFVLYEAYSAMNLHFNQSNDYDYFKYNGKTNRKIDSFNKHRFKWQHASLEDKLEHVLWFLFQMFEQNNFGFLPEKTLLYKGNKLVKKEQYVQHPNDYLNSWVVGDLKWLNKKYNGSTMLFNQDDGMYPNLYNHYMNQDISLVTFLLINSTMHNVLTKDQSRDIINWPQVVSLMKKIQPFVEDMFDRKTFVKLFRVHYLQQ